MLESTRETDVHELWSEEHASAQMDQLLIPPPDRPAAAASLASQLFSENWEAYYKAKAKHGGLSIKTTTRLLHGLFKWAFSLAPESFRLWRCAAAARQWLLLP